MATLDGNKAVSTLLGYGTYAPGMCLEAVSKALGSYWLTSDRPGYYQWALRAYETTPKSELSLDKNGLRGQVGYLSNSSFNKYGHIFLFTGNGQEIVSTDVPYNGKVGVTTVDALCRAWGRKYLGRSSRFMGHTINTGGSTGGGSVSNDTVASRQRYLKHDRGESKLVTDGIDGPATKAAVKRYQQDLKDAGLYKGAIDGIWGAGTESAHQSFKSGTKGSTSSSSNPFGIGRVSGLQKVARLYGYKGKIDDIWGSGSAAGFAQFLRVNWGYRGNDVLGQVMWTAIARWLRTRWGYRGNDVPGPVMRAALKRAEEANYREL